MSQWLLAGQRDTISAAQVAGCPPSAAHTYQLWYTAFGFLTVSTCYLLQVQQLAAALDEFEWLSHNRSREGSALLLCYLRYISYATLMLCRCSSWQQRLTKLNGCHMTTAGKAAHRCCVTCLMCTMLHFVVQVQQLAAALDEFERLSHDHSIPMICVCS
jgi:hypothetical protein